ncbi:MAG: class I SAM-dependent methyltransferase [Dehalococcoidia bacterium]
MTTVTRPVETAAPEAAAVAACALCGGSSSKRVLDAKQRTVVECRDCGLRALSPMPTLGDMVGINAETVHPFFNACLEDEASYRAYFDRKLDDLQRYQRSGRLLDVGCGAGFFLDAARTRGYSVAGVDLSPVPAAYAQDALGLDVAVSSLYAYEAPSDAFDAVTIFQTIEHDPDPAALCAELYRIVAPGGVLMVTTPAADGFVARAMGKRWFGYRNVEHVSFFSRRSLRFALERAGFEIVFLDVEHGKRLSMKYVLNRLINYYYDHRAFLRNGLRILHPALLLLGMVPLFEPWAHLYVLARKPEAGVPPEFRSANGHSG